MVYYIFTVKSKGTVYTTDTELRIFLDNFMSKTYNIEWSEHIVFEMGKKGRLHMHGICVMPYTLRYKYLITKFKTKRLHIHFQRFPEKDYNIVLKYLYKEYELANANNRSTHYYIEANNKIVDNYLLNEWVLA